MAVQEVARCQCCHQLLTPPDLPLSDTQARIYILILQAARPPSLKELAHILGRDPDLVRTHIAKMNLRLKPFGLYIAGSRTRGAPGYKLVEARDVSTNRRLGPQHVGRAGTVSDLWGCPVSDVWPRITRRLPMGGSVAVVLEEKPVRKNVSAASRGREPERDAAADIYAVPPRGNSPARVLAAPYRTAQNLRPPRR